MPFHFIVRPKNNEQYINTKQIGDTELIINTSIEDAKDVQRVGVVLSLPSTYKGDIRIGDEVIVHHNIFRITYNGKGVAMQSDFHIKENLFHVEPDLIYMAIRDGEKMAVDHNVFVEPIKITDTWLGEIEREHVGIMRYPNATLQSQGINKGDTVAFYMECEYPFDIDGTILYMMKNNRILAKLEA